MTRSRALVPLAFIFATALPTMARALPAFPGAEGSAAETVGGRGGAVYIVDTLSDNAADGVTFREACMASGPRIVVFAVSGWIDLKSTLEISSDKITIAGQSSPGGIGVRGETVRISANDVLVTHMRFAAGSLQGDERDSLQIWGPADNVMIDHSSIRWGCDESGETAYNPLRVTIGWSVIGPGLYNCAPESNHNLGFLVWGGNDTKITFHHDFFPHNRYRNPEVNGGSGGDAPMVDLVNNVGFDSFGGYTGFHTYAGNSRANVVHNWFKLGSENNTDAREGILFGGESSNGDGSYYVVGNAGAWRSAWNDSSAGHADWDSLKTEWNGSTPHTSWRKTSPHVFPGIAVSQTNITSEFASLVVASSGATKPVIDSADAKYKSDYEGGVHAFLNGDSVGNTTGSYPTFTASAPPADTDNDGMADAWEVDHGLQVGTNDSAGDDGNDGYTNIEEYLHSLGGYAAGSTGGSDGGVADGGVVSDSGVASDGGVLPDGGIAPDGAVTSDSGSGSGGSGGAGPKSGAGDSTDDGGCSIAPTRSASSVFGVVLSLLGLFCLRQRPRRFRIARS